MLDLLERFCTGSTSSAEPEDLLRGKASYIRRTIQSLELMIFMEFLDRHRFKEFKLQEVTALLKKFRSNTYW
jgi:hypothetical protein